MAFFVSFLGSLDALSIDLWRVFEIDKPSRVDSGIGDQFAGVLIDAEGDDHDAVFGHHLSIEDDFGEVGFTFSRSIHEDIVGGDFALAASHEISIGFDDVAVFGENDLLVIHSDFERELFVGVAEHVFSMHGDEVAWRHELKHEFELFLVSMPRGMHIHMLVGDDFHAMAQKIVDHVHDVFFVPDDGIGGEDDGITRMQFDFTVFTHGDPVEG